jgi:copper homeostasis protein
VRAARSHIPTRRSRCTRHRRSGSGPSVPTSLPVLHQLLLSSRAPGRPRILPGSGINATTIAAVLTALSPHGLREVHMSGGGWRAGGMAYRVEGMGMGVGGGHDWDVWCTDASAVRAVRRVLDDANSVEA